MRNAAPRRPHRERSQPGARSKWGLLEKHKDYSLRAKDFNQKKQKLNILSQKARDRNPDEFAFSMINNAQGKHGRNSTENVLSHDAVKLLKTQDAGYLRTVAGRTRREIEKVEQEVGMGKALKKTSEEQKKIVFDEETGTEPARKKRRISVSVDGSDGGEEDRIEIVSEAVGKENEAVKSVTLLSKKRQQREKDRLAQLKADRKRRKRLQEVRANKLEVLKKRQKDIFAAADQLELQRAKMANAVGGVNKNGIKFKVRERKR